MNKISKKVWIAVVAVVAVLVVVIVGVNVLGGTSDYQGTLKKFAKAFESNDYGKIEGMASSISEKVYGQYGDAKEQYKRLLNGTKENYKNVVGEITKISYKVSSERELDESRLEELKDNLKAEYDMDTSKIEKIMQVVVEVSVDGKETSSDFSETIFFVKESGGWKIHVGYLP